MSSVSLGAGSLASGLGAVQSIASSQASSAQTAQIVSPDRQAAGTPNPDRTVDPGLNMVVTRYFSPGGVLVGQYPSEKAVQQYRLFGTQISS